ncbi:MAG: spore germination protein, partial [Faecalibacterium prausnitzii]
MHKPSMVVCAAYSAAAKRAYCTHKGVMDVQQLSQSLAENLSALDARFGQSADYYAKKIVLYGCPGCIVMFDGMASLDSLWELLLDAAGRQSASVRLTGTQAYAHILHGSAFPAESTPVQDMSQLVARLTAGMAVLLLEGCSSGIAFSVQGLKFRSVEEPSGEGNLRGSREGFTDLLRVNLSLLRRLVRT